MKRHTHPARPRWRIAGFLFLLACASSAPSKEQAHPPRASEKELKALFGYSFNDISGKIATVSCTSKEGRSAGSGFVAIQDGKTYLFTNQHVILGSDRISFKTTTGKTLRPSSVELSASRDIARLLLADETEGLRIAVETATTGTPVAVFGNSEGGGVATELYGEVVGGDADLVEISARIVPGNSGSPVLNLDREVLGIASYGIHLDNDKNGSKTRRFCYRLDGGHWSSVNWKRYNAKYGKQLREAERLLDSVLELIEIWHNVPYSRIPSHHFSTPGLCSWVRQHNNMIDTMMELIDEEGGVTPRRLKHVNDQVKGNIRDGARTLAFQCRGHVRQMRRFSKQKGNTKFLHDKFEYLAEEFEAAAQEAERYGAKLAKHDYFHFK